MGFYFDKFEHRTPPEPVPHRPVIELSLAVFSCHRFGLGW
jgi:hypothetical protein